MKWVMDRTHSSSRSRRRARARRRSRVHAHHPHPRQRIGRAAGCYGANARRSSGRGSTLLALVQEVQRRARTDAEVVRIVRRMVNTGVVVLTGTFAGRMI
jgi:hypothetical protein